MKKIKLQDSVYKKDIYIITDIDYKKFVLYLNNKYGSNEIVGDDETPRGEAFEICKKNKAPIYYVWIEELNTTPQWLHVLAHELLHVTFFIMSYVSIDLSDDSEEAYTYHFDSLFKQIYEKIYDK